MTNANISPARRAAILASARASQARRTADNRKRAAEGRMINLGSGNSIARIARDLGLTK